MMTSPVYPPSFPGTSYPTAPIMPPPSPQWPMMGAAARPQALPAGDALVQQPRPARTVRGQMGAEPPPSVPPRPAEQPPAPLVIPSPEQLGLACAEPAAGDSPDWTALHRRLDQLGAWSIQLDKLPAGGCRFTCLLPTGTPDRFHRVESQAGTPAEAVRLALDDAEKWAGGK
ncbi:MAG TPA: hypothetical protein VG013_19235 [Gemmataceae bacterium]|jgi:hypothetical protein|nr:hypothetical protein [Gemmataceae bacterium]